MGMRGQLSEEDRSLVRKLLGEAEEAVEVLEEVLAKRELSRSDLYAARYAVVQIVEAFAAIAARVAAARGASIEGYAESMEFLGRAGVVRSDVAPSSLSSLGLGT